MIRQIVGTIIGTLLFCIVALAGLDYMGRVKVFDIDKIAHIINDNGMLTGAQYADTLTGDMSVYDGVACPVGMIISKNSAGGLVCQHAKTIGDDCIGLDGKIIKNGETSTGYKSDYNACKESPRLCNNGVLEGDTSFALASCQTYVPGAQDCAIQDDLIVAEHQSIIRRGNEKADLDTSCAYIKMVCEKGSLTGIEDFSGSMCEFKQSLSPTYLKNNPQYLGTSGEVVGLEYVAMPGNKACTTPRGSGIEDGKSVLSFQNDTVAYKEKCIYNISYCKDGILDAHIFTHPTCEVQKPSSCQTPWNINIEHGQTVSGYQIIKDTNGTTQCTSELRVCIDGKLSGSYDLKSCDKETTSPSALKKTILPTGQCKTPRGKRIDNGKSIVAYQDDAVAYDQYCQSETRVCRNGVLDGSFTARSCVVGEVKSCMTPRGTAVKHGDAILAYADQTVGYASVCASENRYCNDGVLDGSFQYSTCAVSKPVECPLPRGGTVAHGQSVFAYQKTQVTYGQTCAAVAEQRRCSNGRLGGSYMFESCEVEPAADCVSNRGTIKHGKTIARYQAPQVYGQVADGADQCVRFTLTCNNGEVGGSLLDHPEAVYKSCTVVFPDDPN